MSEFDKEDSDKHNNNDFNDDHVNYDDEYTSNLDHEEESDGDCPEILVDAVAKPKLNQDYHDDEDGTDNFFTNFLVRKYEKELEGSDSQSSFPDPESRLSLGLERIDPSLKKFDYIPWKFHCTESEYGMFLPPLSKSNSKVGLSCESLKANASSLTIIQQNSNEYNKFSNVLKQDTLKQYLEISQLGSTLSIENICNLFTPPLVSKKQIVRPWVVKSSATDEGGFHIPQSKVAVNPPVHLKAPVDPETYQTSSLKTQQINNSALNDLEKSRSSILGETEELKHVDSIIVLVDNHTWTDSLKSSCQEIPIECVELNETNLDSHEIITKDDDSEIQNFVEDFVNNNNEGEAREFDDSENGDNYKDNRWDKSIQEIISQSEQLETELTETLSLLEQTKQNERQLVDEFRLQDSSLTSWVTSPWKVCDYNKITNECMQNYLAILIPKCELGKIINENETDLKLESFLAQNILNALKDIKKLDVNENLNSTNHQQYLNISHNAGHRTFSKKSKSLEGQILFNQAADGRVGLRTVGLLEYTQQQQMLKQRDKDFNANNMFANFPEKKNALISTTDLNLTYDEQYEASVKPHLGSSAHCPNVVAVQFSQIFRKYKFEETSSVGAEGAQVDSQDNWVSPFSKSSKKYHSSRSRSSKRSKSNEKCVPIKFKKDEQPKINLPGIEGAENVSVGSTNPFQEGSHLPERALRNAGLRKGVTSIYNPPPNSAFPKLLPTSNNDSREPGCSEVVVESNKISESARSIEIESHPHESYNKSMKEKKEPKYRSKSLRKKGKRTKGSKQPVKNVNPTPEQMEIKHANSNSLTSLEVNLSL